MSYEAWGEPDDEDDWMDRAEKAGWVSEDVVETLRALLKHVDMGEDFPRAGSMSDAALVMVDRELNPPPADKPEDPAVTWAKRMLSDIYG